LPLSVCPILACDRRALILSDKKIARPTLQGKTLHRITRRRLGRWRAPWQGGTDPVKTDEDFGRLDADRDGYLTFDEFSQNTCKNGRYER
jgi:hypothetical protein